MEIVTEHGSQNFHGLLEDLSIDSTIIDKLTLISESWARGSLKLSFPFNEL